MIKINSDSIVSVAGRPLGKINKIDNLKETDFNSFETLINSCYMYMYIVNPKDNNGHVDYSIMSFIKREDYDVS